MLEYGNTKLDGALGKTYLMVNISSGDIFD